MIGGQDKERNERDMLNKQELSATRFDLTVLHAKCFFDEDVDITKNYESAKQGDIHQNKMREWTERLINYVN